MNKKGILPKNVLKMVIAVICILLLFTLAGNYYGIYFDKTHTKQSEESLNQLFLKMESLEKGEIGNYLMTSPKDWYIVFYEPGDNMPDKCEGKDCVCICPGEDLIERSKIVSEDSPPYGDYFYTEKELGSLPTGGLTKCQEEGSCKIVERNLKTKRVYFGDRESPNLQTGTLSFVNWIYISEVPKDIFLKNDSDLFYISEEEIDSKIMTNFLDKEIEFEGEIRKVSDFLNMMFEDCSNYEEWSSSKPKKNKELYDLIKIESENYLIDLINREEIKGGKIIISSYNYPWFANLLFVQEGDKKSCSLLERKEICSNKIDIEKEIGGYIRFYIC
jgi:hypothetical protein